MKGLGRLEEVGSLRTIDYARSEAVTGGGVPLLDPDPTLNALEQQGKAVFQRACAHCHRGPGQSGGAPGLALRFHDIGSQCPRSVDTVTPPRWAFKPCPPTLVRNARSYEILLICDSLRMSRSSRLRLAAAAFDGSATHSPQKR
jgi:hypothetical protein